jgi:hypothetical protein
MASSIKAEQFRFQRNSYTWLEGEVALTSIPQNIAFDVYARTNGGKESSLGCSARLWRIYPPPPVLRGRVGEVVLRSAPLAQTPSQPPPEYRGRGMN